MADKTIFGCAETGTYSTDAPNPHVALSGTVTGAYALAQLFADALATNDTATVSVVKDKDNWAVYAGAKFTNASPDTLDLSVATLLESKGSVTDTAAVTCIGLAPGARGVSAARVYRNAALTSPDRTTAIVLFDAVSYDNDGLWDAANYRFIPKRPGYYLVNTRYQATDPSSIVLSVRKNAASHATVGSNTVLATTLYAHSGSTVLYCNGTTDYVDILVYTYDDGAVSTGADLTWCEIIGPLAA